MESPLTYRFDIVMKVVNVDRETSYIDFIRIVPIKLDPQTFEKFYYLLEKTVKDLITICQDVNIILTDTKADTFEVSINDSFPFIPQMISTNFHESARICEDLSWRENIRLLKQMNVNHIIDDYIFHREFPILEVDTALDDIISLNLMFVYGIEPRLSH